MAALNGGLGSSGLSNGTGSTMEALTQAYSGIQQYAAAALPTLYNQNLLAQQSIGAAGSQKEGEWGDGGRSKAPEGHVDGQASTDLWHCRGFTLKLVCVWNAFWSWSHQDLCVPSSSGAAASGEETYRPACV